MLTCLESAKISVLSMTLELLNLGTCRHPLCDSYPVTSLCRWVFCSVSCKVVARKEAGFEENGRQQR